MPRQGKGARLRLRPARRDKNGNVTEHPHWIIKDDGRQISTGCGAVEREEAEKALAAHLVSKHTPARTEKPLSDVFVADVIKIYLDDVVPDQVRPEKAGERAKRLLGFFGRKTLDDITGALCREYVTSREGLGKSNKGKGGGAKRDLEDLRAAINHHAKRAITGPLFAWYCRQGGRPGRWPRVPSSLNCSGRAGGRESFKSPNTTAGPATTGRRQGNDPLRHLCRLLLIGVYTGSRPGAIFSASWTDGDGRSFVDLNSAMGSFTAMLGEP